MEEIDEKDPKNWKYIPLAFSNLLHSVSYGDISVSLDVLINTKVVNVMRKIPQIYDSCIKYILNTTQRHLKLALNPVYEERNFMENREKKINFYKIENLSLKIKKGYRDAKGREIVPERVGLETEEEKRKKVREILKKNIEKKSQKAPNLSFDEKNVIFKKNDNIEKNIVENKKLNIAKKDEEKRFNFEILKEEVDYKQMILEEKIEKKNFLLKIKLEDYESISLLNVDISDKEVKVTEKKR